MKKITLQQIIDLSPCYDPTKYLSKNWKGTVIDILNVEECPAEDRLWVVLREDFIDAKTLRLFAAWCAREALKLIDKPDQRSIEACNVAERYANGDATKEELAAARAAAIAAAWAAASDAARAAAIAAAIAAARAAACAAESDAARAAAWAAARAAAWAAESDAARAAARAAHITQLKIMLCK
jgi:hypothetical protein